MTTDEKCKDRIAKEWDSTKIGWLEASKEDRLNEFGLAIDYVRANTFNDQPAGYLRYQFSWGGPSDELRIFKNGRIEYWFLDWFDGTKKIVTNEPIAKQMAEYARENIGLGIWK